MTQEETDYYEEVKTLLEIEGVDTEPSRTVILSYMQEGLTTAEAMNKLITDWT